MPTLNFTTNDHILAFVDYYTISLSRGKKTASEYARDTSRFERFIAPTPLLQATTDQIQAWLDSLLREGRNKPQSVKRKYAAVRAFFRFAVKKKLLAGENPCGEDAIELPKCARPLPVVMSEEEVQLLLNATKEYRRYGAFLDPRDRAIMHLMYASGLRRFEITGLDIADIDFGRERVRVRHGKGDKERYVYIKGNHVTLAALREYLVVRPLRENDRSEDALFITVRGDRLTPRELWCVFRDLRVIAEGMGLTKHVKPHTMRHSFATHIFRKSRNIRAVQKMLGHSSINTTERYTHIEDEELAEIYAACHPGAQAS